MAARKAFTLVELLVTVLIVGILASLAMAAYSAVQRAAREDRTRATIAKINAYIMEQYEAYRTRRMPISTTGCTPVQAAQRRLDAVRDLMRMEMPDRINDITSGPYGYVYSGVTSPIPEPAIHRRFVQRYNLKKPSDDYASAECLYLTVMAHDPEAREHFNDSEIADVDGDGWNEFIDGWGNPIKWLRWAPGFCDSDVQRTTWDIAANAYSTAAITAAVNEDHDPFDSRKLDVHAWRLVPLIYSAGPDGIYDISTGGATYSFNGSPYWNSATSEYLKIGNPVDSDNTSVTATESANGSQDHYDNITNHRGVAD